MRVVQFNILICVFRPMNARRGEGKLKAKIHVKMTIIFLWELILKNNGS